MTKYQSPKPLPDEHMRLVGIVATHWEWVEVTLQRTVAEAMGLKYGEVALLNENISFHAHCDLLMIYARPLEKTAPASWDEFTAVHTDLKNAYTARNKYVHAKWMVYSDAPIKRTDVRTRNGKLSIVDQPTTEIEIASAAQQIWDAGERLKVWAQGFGLLLT